jgi:AcrR family transcriptional regulator
MSNDDLLDIARAVFLERGVEATTIEIAKRARISESVIFYRYGTKGAFIRALLERELVLPDALTRLAAKAGGGDIADHLFDAAMSLIELSRRVQPLLAVAAAKVASEASHDRYASQHPVRREISSAVARYFEAETKSGRLRAIPPKVLARMFVGAITGLVSEERAGHPKSTEDVPAFVRCMIDVLLQGARPDPS